MKFEIRKAADGQFYFVLKARNGEIIATSETYATKPMCKKGIKAVIKVSISAPVIDLT
jgi:uncharacterized protein YegP (UPF0339 family)